MRKITRNRPKNRNKKTRRYKKGGVAPSSPTSLRLGELFDERYTNAIENIRTEYPEIYNTIQHLRLNGVRSEDIPQIEYAIRTLRRRIYFSPPNSNSELNQLLNRIEEIHEQIHRATFRDVIVGHGGKHKKYSTKRKLRKY